MMARRLFLIAILIASCSACATHAQVAELYGTINFTHASNLETGSVYTSSGYVEKFTSATPVGVGGGLTLNFLPLPVVKLGVDLRGSTRPGTVGVDTALGGIKLTVKPPALKVKPFLEAAAGYLGTRTVNVSTNSSTGAAIGGTFSNNYAIYEIIGGVDYPLVHFVDFRVEAAGGSSTADSAIIGNSSNGHAHIFTVNTGFVLHF